MYPSRVDNSATLNSDKVIAIEPIKLSQPYINNKVIKYIHKQQQQPHLNNSKIASTTKNIQFNFPRSQCNF